MPVVNPIQPTSKEYKLMYRDFAPAQRRSRIRAAKKRGVKMRLPDMQGVTYEMWFVREASLHASGVLTPRHSPAPVLLNTVCCCWFVQGVLDNS
jgi:hypothetical protein